MCCTVRAALAVACAGLFAFDLSAANPFGLYAPANANPVPVAAGMRARYARADWSWSAIEYIPADFQFPQQDRDIANSGIYGVRLLPVFSIGTAPYITGRALPRDPARSYPPKDVLAENHRYYVYSPSLYEAVLRIFGRYRGRLSYVVFESEPELDSSWGGTAEEYVKMLATFRKALREVDPNVKLVAGGFSSSSLGLLIAKDWIETGVRKREDAIAFALRYYNEAMPPELVPVGLGTAAGIAAALEDPASSFNTSVWPRANVILEGLGGVADALDFHFYQSHTVLPTVLSWLKERGRRAKVRWELPVFSTGMGVRSPSPCDASAAELDRIARETFKTMISARASGLEIATIATGGDRCAGPGPASFWNSDQALRPAGETFRRLAEVIGNAAGVNRIVQDGPDFHYYIFNDFNARPGIVAAWSENGPTALTVTVDATGPAQLWDYRGRPGAPEARGSEIRLASDGPLLALLPPLAFRFSAVSAASYAAGPVAQESIVSAFGADLRSEPAETMMPLTYIDVLDAAGIIRHARIFYAGPTQINFQIPPGTSTGAARVTIGRGDTVIATGTVQIARSAPGLFSANGDGKGPAAANVVRVAANGGSSIEDAAQLASDGRAFVTRSIRPAAASERLVLVLYGTGIRFAQQVGATIGGIAAPVEFSGPHPQFAGLDQVNVALPAGLAGRGEIEVRITADGTGSNSVSIRVE